MRRLLALLLLLFATTSHAQVLSVNVGITPACPYGLSACWGGAEQGLSRMTGVESVTHKPDAMNSLAEVHLNSASLPDVAKWSDQFHAIVGQVYAFRGIEVVVRGELVQQQSGVIFLKVPHVDAPIELMSLHHKLQWNNQQAKPREIQPGEAAAYGTLIALFRPRDKFPPTVRITGPLTVSGNDRHLVLEVRGIVLDDSRRPTTVPTTMPVKT